MLSNYQWLRFSNSSSDAKAVYLEFGHDTTIDMALTALGLAKWVVLLDLMYQI